MSDLKLVIFDVDGTLIDSQAHIIAAMGRAFSDLGLDVPPRAQILGGVGLSLPVLINHLLPEADANIQSAVVEGYKSAFAELRQADGHALSPFFPGGRDTLERLGQQDNLLLGIATGKSRRGMMHLIQMHGLERMFQTVQVADDHPSKPNPSMILTCLAETGVERQNAVMLGDTVFDMEMAQHAGVAAIGVDWGYHHAADLRTSGAIDVLSDFDALDGALNRIWSG